MDIQRSVFVLLGILVLTPMASCAKPIDADLPPAVLEGGYDKQVIATKDGTRLQVVRKFKLSYPNMALSQQDRMALEAAGWNRCSSANEKWERVFELDEKRLVHQVTNYWTKDGRLLTINMRYITPAESAPPAGAPASDIQLVTMLLDDYGVRLKDVVTKLDVKC